MIRMPLNCGSKNRSHVALARELANGAEIEERPDGLVIEGGRPLTGAVESGGSPHGHGPGRGAGRQR